MSKFLVISHADCVDGFTAAWVLSRNGLVPPEDIECVFLHYGDPPPDVEGKHVIVVDFSFPRDVLLEMSDKAHTLFVFDHHGTAKKALDGVENCVFDESRSGAGLAWDEARKLWNGENPTPRPALVDYVEDRDLWKFRLPSSKQVNAYIHTRPRTFEEWDKLSNLLEWSLDEAIALGDAAWSVTENHIREVLKRSPRFVRIGEWLVPCVNCTFAISETIGALAEAWPEAPFAAGWFEREDGQLVYSLRSRGDFDVSVVAKSFGGGGHPGAAGFRIRRTPLATITP